jgi:hypothetical protein
MMKLGYFLAVYTLIAMTGLGKEPQLTDDAPSLDDSNRTSDNQLHHTPDMALILTKDFLEEPLQILASISESSNKHDATFVKKIQDAYDQFFALRSFVHNCADYSNAKKEWKTKYADHIDLLIRLDEVLGDKVAGVPIDYKVTAGNAVKTYSLLFKIGKGLSSMLDANSNLVKPVF